MLNRNLWKLLLSFAIVAISVISLLPVEDQKFETYVKTHATDKKTEFEALVKEAEAINKATPSTSVYSALKQIAKSRRIDLSQYFPGLNFGDVKSIDRRNNLLLEHLLSSSKGKLQLGLDLKGGVGVTLEVDKTHPDYAKLNESERKEKLGKAIEIISNRINGLGVAEPVIRPVGDGRIEIQMPGLNTKDNPDVLNNIKKPAVLSFHLVHPFMMPGMSPETPAGYSAMTLEDESRDGEASVEEVYVRMLPEMTGEGIADAFPRYDQFGKAEIIIQFTKEGRARFAKVTGGIASENQRSGRPGRLAIVLDGKLYSAPSVREEIDNDSAQITGSFTDREAQNLAEALRNPLDLPLKTAEQYIVGPTLAEDAVASGKLAFKISAALTVIFVLIFYTIGGVIAALGMLVNVLVTLAVMSYFGATLSLPGIAGIVLTLAMSVDSNILIFERMREELRLGKSLPTALESGFEKAWSAILDSNLTTLIVAAIMIWLGTGPVRGFGVTLTIGIFTTMFAAVVVSKLIMEAAILPGVLKKFPMFSVLQDTRYDFMKAAKPAFIASMLVVAIGIGAVAYKGKEVYGIDFTGGDSVTIAFAQKIDTAKLQKAAADAGFKDASFSFQSPIGTGIEELKANTRFEQGEPLFKALEQAFPQAKLEQKGITQIGPSVGEEIQWNALKSLGFALLGILIYVAFRFEIGYSIGAVVATAHDLLMTIGIFVLFGGQFNSSMVAAILLIAGYSINDTIVVFDRIREELKLNPNMSLRDLINRSLNLTLSRTVITGGTTLLSAITLMLVTTGDVKDIAFTLLIGVITGTFSSLFIASPIFFWYHKGDRKHVEKHQDVKPTYEWTGASKASE